MDPTGPSMMDGYIIIYNHADSECTVLILSNKVKDSMKICLYDSQIVVNQSDLIACQCSCKCGSETNERILDVYPLSLLMDLVLLLYVDLAQNILI